MYFCDNRLHPAKFILPLLSALFFSVSSACVNAQQPDATGTVKLATGEGYFPFVDQEMPDGGWSTLLVGQTFKKLNLKTSIEVLPWKRALKWTQEGQFVGAYPFVYSSQRAEQFLYSTPINFVPVHMYAASQSAYKQPQDLMGKRLCFPFSYSLDSVEQGIVERFKMTINRAKDGIGCIKHVQKGWSDAGLTNGHIQATRFPKNNNNSIVIFTDQLAVVPLHLVVSKEHPQASKWIEEFNHGFDLLEQSGEKTQIDQQFLQLLKAL
jgi:polar amino acid transport system substrate-binding protein